MTAPAPAARWTHETSTDIATTPTRVWQLWSDVARWPRWNAGVARAALHGPFASGSTFEMQLPDGGPLLHSRLVDVRLGERFTDETAFEGVVVRVTHAMSPLAAGGVRVTYRTEVEGPNAAQAAEIGAGVSSDFPAVLQSLKAVAEANPNGPKNGPLMTAPITFYTHPWSRGRVARWMLEETGLPYATEVLEYGTTMKAPAYHAINPMGKVPAIKHGDTVVTENAAILMYLADLVPEKKLAPAAGSPERGPYYRWISFMGPVEAMLTAKSTGTLAKPEQAGYGSEADALDTLEGAVRGRDHLAGEHFTAADLFVASLIGFYLQFKMLEPRPEFVRFAQLHAQRPAARRAGAIDDALAAQLQAAAGKA